MDDFARVGRDHHPRYLVRNNYQQALQLELHQQHSDSRAQNLEPSTITTTTKTTTITTTTRPPPPPPPLPPPPPPPLSQRQQQQQPRQQQQQQQQQKQRQKPQTATATTRIGGWIRIQMLSVLMVMMLTANSMKVYSYIMPVEIPK